MNLDMQTVSNESLSVLFFCNANFIKSFSVIKYQGSHRLEKYLNIRIVLKSP